MSDTRTGRMWTVTGLLVTIGCGNQAGTEPNMSGFFSERYEQCQVGTTSEDLVVRNPDIFEARQFAGTNGTIPYRLFVPDNYDPTRSYPLVLWLHGSSGRGTDNESQILTGANLVATHTFASPEVQGEHPSFVLAPQVTGSWASDDRVALTTNMLSTLGLLDQLEMEFAIDRQRVYVMGNSLGGAGTWDLVTKGPDRFAAAVPMASDIEWGGVLTSRTGLPSVAAALKGKKFWFFYGGNDFSGVLRLWWDEVATLIRDDGGAPRYTEYVDGGHGVARCVFTEPGLIRWLFDQRLGN